MNLNKIRFKETEQLMDLDNFKGMIICCYVGKNKYVKHAHISEAKFRQIILLFSEDLSATQISHLTKVSRPTVNKYLTAIRLRILELSLLQSDPLVGQIEVDESYFGARRVRGKRGRGARGKTIVFGLFKRASKVILTQEF